jgi:hypothetical protein
MVKVMEILDCVFWISCIASLYHFYYLPGN